MPEGGSHEQNQRLQERRFHPPARPEQVSQVRDNIGLVCCSRPFFAPLRRAEPAGTLPPKYGDLTLGFLCHFLCREETRPDGCTTARMHLTPPNRITVGNMGRFLLCVFCRNKNNV